MAPEDQRQLFMSSEDALHYKLQTSEKVEEFKYFYYQCIHLNLILEYFNLTNEHIYLPVRCCPGNKR